MIVYRTTWQQGIRPEYQDHDSEAKAEAHEAALRRKGHDRVAVYRVEMTK